MNSYELIIILNLIGLIVNFSFRFESLNDNIVYDELDDLNFLEIIKILN
jgi:hypothetical protein